MKRVLAIFVIALPLTAQVRLASVRLPDGYIPGSAQSEPEAPNLHLRTDTLTADQTWTAPGNGTFYSATSQTPNAVDIEAWGAGGGGTQGVGGGGGGAYSLCQDEAVTPATGYAVEVGISAANTTGEDSTFDTDVCVAKGGQSGTAGSQGGTAAASTGDTKFSGGNGRIAAGSCGGGGGAGTTANGSNSSSSVGGAGGAFFGGRGGPTGNQQARLVASGGGSDSSAQWAGKRGAVRINYWSDVGPGFPVIESYAPTASTAAGTSHAINLPTCAAGKYYVVVSSFDGVVTLSGSGSWSELTNDFIHPQNSHTLGVFSLTSTGSDSLTITSSGSSLTAALAYCFGGATGAPELGPISTGNGINGNPNGVIYSGGPGKHLFLATMARDISQSDTTNDAPPAGWNDFLSLTASTGTTTATEISVATLHDINSTANPGPFSSSDEQWMGATIVIPGELDSGVPVPVADPSLSFAATGATRPNYGTIGPAGLYLSGIDSTILTWEAWDTDHREAQITSYDHTADTWSSIVDVGITMLSDDDHGTPALVRDHQGYIHLFGGNHNSTALRHASTNSPDDISAWTVRTALSGTSRGYPKPIMIGSTMWLLSREGTSEGSDYTVTSTSALNDGVATWNSFITIIDLDLPGPAIERVYCANVEAVGTDIYFACQASDEIDTYRYNVYFFVYETATGDLCNMGKGTCVDAGDLPIDRTEADADFLVFEHGASRGGVDNVPWFLDGSDNPHLFYADGPIVTSPDEGPFDIYYTFWNGSSWETPEQVPVQVQLRFDSFTPILLGDGSIQLYYFIPWNPTQTEGQPALIVRSSGGTWGSGTQIMRADQKNLARFMPVKDGTAEIRGFFCERAHDANIALTANDDYAGGLMCFAYGDGGFVARP